MEKNKAQLENESKKLERELNNQLSELTGKVEKWGTTLLFVGGGLLLAYRIFEMMNDDPAEKAAVKTESKQKELLNKILAIAGEQVTMLLLAYLRNKLITVLSDRPQETETQDEQEKTFD